MPEMGGVEFMKRYSKLPGEKPPIVVLSNMHDQQIVEEVRSLGAVDYVVKSQITPATMCKLAQRFG